MTIQIFSRPTCSPCRTLKYYLDKKGLEYTVLDADENREELLKYSNAPIVPITVINNGEHVIEGLNLQRMAEVLA
jgi:glutaredoxin